MSSHTWEPRRHSWEDPIAAHGAAADEWGAYDSDDGECVPEFSPGQEFVQAMLDLLLIRTLNAKQFCTLMHLAGKAGIAEAVRYGHRPGANSGHYSRHLDPILRWRKHDASLLAINVPTFSRSMICRTVTKMPIFAVHEHLAYDFANEVGGRTRLREAVQEQRLPPCYYNHPVVRSAGESWVIPLAVYLDFVPYAINDSVLGIWVVNLMNERQAVLALCLSATQPLPLRLQRLVQPARSAHVVGLVLALPR